MFGISPAGGQFKASRGTRHSFMLGFATHLIVNYKRTRSNHVRSCLASLENALKACADVVIASALAFIPDLLPVTVRRYRSNRLIASRFVRLHFLETTTCVFSIRWRLTPSRLSPVR